MGGAVPRPIARRALAELAQEDGLHEEEAALLVVLVAEMDGVFFDHQEQLSKRAAEEAKRRR
ncbi:hypothetical protein HMPREF9946_02568 [Acetobacteraceae bacterium AT-5844]|nr:hypothetical protein HMPREF9946_02568 [Acetobacteraceae bacterium AT-5844]